MNSLKGEALPLPFLDFETNSIRFTHLQTQTHIAEQLHLAQQGNGRLNVLHIGDSHIQADLFTGEVRRVLAQHLGDSTPSRGFVFPYGIVGTNNSADIATSSKGLWVSTRILDGEPVTNTGVAGISASTQDEEACITIRLKRSKSFNRVTILFDDNVESFYPIVDKGQCQWGEKGLVQFSVSDTSNCFTLRLLRLNRTQKSFTLFGFIVENENTTLTYNAAGLNGADVKAVLRNLKLAQQVKQLKPDIVVLSLGTNDTYNSAFNREAFKGNLHQLISEVRKGSPRAAIILTTPNDHLVSGQLLNPNVPIARNTIIATANELDCGIWDFYTIMGGEGSINQWATNGLSAKDKLHLSPKGYRLQGELFAEALAKLSTNINL
ncbi:MAG: hypothetical protein JW783_10290 [Bacteroidales bacterium]|nr:hypothetical protein [Bacteroidales bacterium]MBN2748943.1 hypothetical protein [Bacteroidales bacterium]